jgi:hypothetical protein
MTKVPSVYETERTSPGPATLAWPVARPPGTGDRPPGPDIRVNRRLPAASRVPE